MPFSTGSRATAVALNRITWNVLEAVVSSDQTVTTTETDVAGASITVTTTQTNTKVKITASLDCELTGTAGDFPFVVCHVDGVAQSANLKFQVLGRASRARTWVVTLGTAGSHTIKLRRQKIGTANTATIYSTHSNLVVEGLGIS